MIHFDLPKQKSSIIKVLGVGGGGSNAVNFMYAHEIEGVDFIICNTDAKALEQSKIPNKIQLGPHLTQGLGAGANPEVGKMATEESLDEIKRILEVNTKMAFVCAGMGGGTGTGGAPIIAKICRELGILTVGIVTTPFGFEGPRRMKQAEEGIRELKPFVDTLLVISNDKLRMQYGNLKMKEAFGKADNVLATAAKCITDIINSRGHIIVDFADVCTVMKNGGVAILGSATAEGEDRAQKAIEEALNSPLLNDNDITGAKWLLLNINSPEGEKECTMDELEVINTYLRMQAGESTDVIMGMGYDNNLGNSISITLIATGFEHRDPFADKFSIPAVQAKPEPRPEKIVMTLGIDGEEKKMYQQQSLPLSDHDPFAPRISDAPASAPVEETLQPSWIENRESLELMELSFPEANNSEVSKLNDSETAAVHFELSPEISAPLPAAETTAADGVPEELNFKISEKPAGTVQGQTPATEQRQTFLAKPSNIYAQIPDQKPAASNYEEPIPVPTPLEATPAARPIEEEPEFEMKLVEKEEDPETADKARLQTRTTEHPVNAAEEPAPLDDAEDQKRRAAERIQKLRNLSFNLNAADPNNEFDSVPAYVRRNMELFGNTLTSVENFYSKYTVSKDEQTNETNISSINTFLDGKKPD
ncbi:MAG TPA: cell division protein FtsZ [Chitinophagaceae bacterium]